MKGLENSDFFFSPTFNLQHPFYTYTHTHTHFFFFNVSALLRLKLLFLSVLIHYLFFFFPVSLQLCNHHNPVLEHFFRVQKIPHCAHLQSLPISNSSSRRPLICCLLGFVFFDYFLYSDGVTCDCCVWLLLLCRLFLNFM